MDYFTADGITTAYNIRGTNGPWVTFAHSLGCSQQMWEHQVQALTSAFRVLTYDLRGHGASTADASPGTLDLLADDLRSLLDHLKIGSTHYVGISIGGMIGQTLAIRTPQRVSSLVLANTAFTMPAPARELWNQRIRQARSEGVAPLAAPALERWFTEAFRAAHPALLHGLQAQFARTTVDGYASCCEAIRDVDTWEGLAQVQCPALVIGGSADPASPPETCHAMAGRIPGAEVMLIPGAGHLSNLDSPDLFTSAMTDFLARQASISQVAA